MNYPEILCSVRPILQGTEGVETSSPKLPRKPVEIAQHGEKKSENVFQNKVLRPVEKVKE